MKFSQIFYVSKFGPISKLNTVLMVTVSILDRMVQNYVELNFITSTCEETFKISFLIRLNSPTGWKLHLFYEQAQVNLMEI